MEQKPTQRLRSTDCGPRWEVDEKGEKTFIINYVHGLHTTWLVSLHSTRGHSVVLSHLFHPHVSYHILCRIALLVLVPCCPVLWCDVMWCDVMWCDVIWWYVDFWSVLFATALLWLMLFLSCSYTPLSNKTFVDPQSERIVRLSLIKQNITPSFSVSAALYLSHFLTIFIFYYRL